jgi:AcrR family transcriptional regulator
MAAPSETGPGERLLRAAQKLTYTHGAHIGLDALLRAAKVARRSLYEHFGGKDELLAAALRRSMDEDETRHRAVMTAAGDEPRACLLALFDAVDAATRSPGFRGCRYLAADLAQAAKDHPVHRVAAEYRQRYRALMEAELRRLGHAHPRRAAEQLYLLIEGPLGVGATEAKGPPGERPRRAIMATTLRNSLAGMPL